MQVSHFDVDRFGGIGDSTVSGSLFNKLSSMSQDEGLGGAMLRWYDAIDELGEDDRLSTTSGKRYTEPFVAFLKVREDGLDAFFLIVTEEYSRTRRWTQGCRDWTYKEPL